MRERILSISYDEWITRKLPLANDRYSVEESGRTVNSSRVRSLDCKINSPVFPIPSHSRCECPLFVHISIFANVVDDFDDLPTGEREL